MKKIIKFILLIISSFGLIFLPDEAWAPWITDIEVTNEWSLAITSGDLISEAGTDLDPDYESPPELSSDAIDIDITIEGGKSSQKFWEAKVHKEDTSWHSNFVLSVQRTSTHTYVYGGIGYQVVDGTSTDFFDGKYSCNDVKVQLKLEGVSVQIPPGVYTTTVYYTLTRT